MAVEARDTFWSSAKRNPGNKYRRALVAASIGSYGAYLADGSEYRCLFTPPNLTVRILFVLQRNYFVYFLHVYGIYSYQYLLVEAAMDLMWI